jgi:hypothetical protein
MWSRRQKSTSTAGIANHNIMGFGTRRPPIASGNKPLEAMRLFVVLGPFLGIVFSVGCLAHFYGASSRRNFGRKNISQLDRNRRQPKI